MYICTYYIYRYIYIYVHIYLRRNKETKKGETDAIGFSRMLFLSTGALWQTRPAPKPKIPRSPRLGPARLGSFTPVRSPTSSRSPMSSKALAPNAPSKSPSPPASPAFFFFCASGAKPVQAGRKKNVFWKAVPTLCQVPVVVRRVKPVHFLKATILFCPGVVFWSDFRSAQSASTAGSDLFLMAYRLCYLNETGQQNHLRWHKVGLVLRHRKSPERAPTAASSPISSRAGPKTWGEPKENQPILRGPQFLETTPMMDQSAWCHLGPNTLHVSR